MLAIFANVLVLVDPGENLQESKDGHVCNVLVFLRELDLFYNLIIFLVKVFRLGKLPHEEVGISEVFVR